MTTIHSRIAALAATCLLFMFAAPAQAVLITGTIDNGPFYSLVHDGIDPYNPGDPDDWLYFETPATFLFDLDLTTGFVTAGGPQTYSLESANGATATFDILALFIDTNNANGFAGGTLDYEYNGTPGQFIFDGMIFGGTRYNSTTFDGTNFQAYAWGADTANNLSLDLRFSGAIVPEPGTLALLGLGLLGITVIRRRRI